MARLMKISTIQRNAAGGSFLIETVCVIVVFFVFPVFIVSRLTPAFPVNNLSFQK